MNSK
jgi:hypothetical protein